MLRAVKRCLSGGDRSAWLGRRDSDLCIAESKSPDKGKDKDRNVRLPARASGRFLGAGHAPKRRDCLARQRVLHPAAGHAQRDARSFSDQLCRKLATTFARNDWLSRAKRGSLLWHG